MTESALNRGRAPALLTSARFGARTGPVFSKILKETSTPNVLSPDVSVSSQKSNRRGRHVVIVRDRYIDDLFSEGETS